MKFKHLLLILITCLFTLSCYEKITCCPKDGSCQDTQSDTQDDSNGGDTITEDGTSM